MATCVVADPTNGILTATTTPVDSCTTYVLMDASTYTDLPTLSQIFATPLASDLQSMWMTGFSITVIAYLSAWAFQSVINFSIKEV